MPIESNVEHRSSASDEPLIRALLARYKCDYPRPQLRREHWITLTGPWDFAIDENAASAAPASVPWSAAINVPFSPETAASGVKANGYLPCVWYRRNFRKPDLAPGACLLLHFGAVDYCADVWVNGIKTCSHHGGYTPFQADITGALNNSEIQEIVVRAQDDPLDLAKPRGKQDWKLNPHSIWYVRTTGIWQTVWLEIVPASFIDTLKWTSNLKRWEIGLDARIGGPHRDGL